MFFLFLLKFYLYKLFKKIFYCAYCNYENNNFPKNICENCWQRNIIIIPFLHKFKRKKIIVYSLGRYEKMLSFIIRSKYIKNQILYIDAADKINEYWKKYNLSADYLIPVPQHRIKRSNRWFNHASIISEELGNMIHVPVYNNLISIKNKKSQVEFTIAERKKQTEDIFYLEKKYYLDLEDKNICIIDDVYTTGATIQAILNSLKDVKYKSIFIFVIARKNF